MKFPKVGLALGAGGARGLAHLGVIRALRRHEIPVDMIAGSSIGAVVGAMYSANLDIDWVEQRFREMLTSPQFAESGIDSVQARVPDKKPDFLEWATRYVRHKLVLNFSDRRPGVVKTERLAQLIDSLLPVKTFAELRLPFACAAVDLQTGNDVVIDEGNLVEAVTASASIPGYLPPMPMESGLLSDGGVGQPVPGDAVRQLGAEFIIAVDVSIHRFAPLAERNIITILGRASEITAARLSQALAHRWDVWLHPDTLDAHWTRFDLIDSLIAGGERVVEQQIDAIRRNLRPTRGVIGWLNRRFGLA